MIVRLAALLSMFAALAAPSFAHAYPRLFLEAGSPCGTCHVSPQGGGVRTDIGWFQDTRAALVLGDLLPTSQKLAGGKVWAGGDFRFQVARLGRPTSRAPTPERRFIPMQMTAHVASEPTSGFFVTASLHAAELAGYRYPGQAPAEGAIQYSPKPSLPTVRAGLIQPSFGIRHEDHTLFVRSNPVNPRSPIVPPTYVEPGVEVSYHPVSWLQGEVGVFSNHYLKEASSGVRGDLSWVMRILFLPQVAKGAVNAWAGVSGYGSGEFLMLNAFAGLGFAGAVSLMFDAAQGSFGASTTTFAMGGVLGWSIKPWLHVSARGEHSSGVAGRLRTESDQLVAGLQFLPVPFLEIRPEYRYLRTSDYILSQYTVQLYAHF